MATLLAPKLAIEIIPTSLHGSNPPYHQWQVLVVTMTEERSTRRQATAARSVVGWESVIPSKRRSDTSMTRPGVLRVRGSWA